MCARFLLRPPHSFLLRRRYARRPLRRYEDFGGGSSRIAALALGRTKQQISEQERPEPLNNGVAKLGERRIRPYSATSQPVPASSTDRETEDELRDISRTCLFEHLLG